MLALTESTLAVPYQLEVLAGGGATYGFHWDAIESLARSKTVDAAIVLMRLAEQRQFEHVTRDLVEAVYRIREGGQPEIIAATDEFTQKHKRSAWRWHQIERDLPN
jgi:cobalamin biosynthesis protein CbiD